MDKYGTTNDSLCYPGTCVLINRLGIRDPQILENAERDLSNAAASSIDFSLPPYDYEYLRSLHKALFGDLYSWAGELRQVDLCKGDTRFCNVNFLQSEGDKIFQRLENKAYLVHQDRAKLIQSVAVFYGDINMLHPFREGNGRSQRVLFEHLVVNAGYEIRWDGIQMTEWVDANISAAYCDYSLLGRLFERCIGNPIA